MSNGSDGDGKDPIWLVVVQVAYVMLWPFINAVGVPVLVVGSFLVRYEMFNNRVSRGTPPKNLSIYTCHVRTVCSTT